jgi:hypothetical protein
MKKEKQSLVVVVVAFAIAGILKLGAAVAGPSTALAAGAAPGVYVISCLMVTPSGTQPCQTGNEIPVGTELALKAHVEDSSGNPAQRGSVNFRDCELKNSVAPSAACDFGPGTWSHLSQMPVDASGNAEVDVGLFSTPRTVGFQFKYLGQGSGIANGNSNSMNVSWF